MDLLVRLYALPADAESKPPEQSSAAVRRAFAAEKHLVATFVTENFSAGWASECEAAFARQPISCFVAVLDAQIAGFACYDATARGFFGPIGVAERHRNAGIGARLLHIALRDMRANGYVYAVIGAVSDSHLYRSVDAIEVPDSSPGFYTGMLKPSR